MFSYLLFSPFDHLARHRANCGTSSERLYPRPAQARDKAGTTAQNSYRFTRLSFSIVVERRTRNVEVLGSILVGGCSKCGTSFSIHPLMTLFTHAHVFVFQIYNFRRRLPLKMLSDLKCSSRSASRASFHTFHNTPASSEHTQPKHDRRQRVRAGNGASTAPSTCNGL